MKESRASNSEEEIINIEGFLKKHQSLFLGDEQFIIRPFKNFSEIEEEGLALKHAVKYYAIAKYAYGKDFLFVLRHKNKPDVPFATLEFDNGGNLLLACKLCNERIKKGVEYDFIERFRSEILIPYLASLPSKKIILDASNKFLVCPSCGKHLVSLSDIGNVTIPENWFCPECQTKISLDSKETYTKRKVRVKVTEEELGEEFYEITIPIGVSNDQFEKVFNMAVKYATVGDCDESKDYDEYFEKMLDIRHNCNGIQTFIEYMNMFGFKVKNIRIHFDYEFTW